MYVAERGKVVPITDTRPRWINSSKRNDAGRATLQTRLVRLKTIQGSIRSGVSFLDSVDKIQDFEEKGLLESKKLSEKELKIRELEKEEKEVDQKTVSEYKSMLGLIPLIMNSLTHIKSSWLLFSEPLPQNVVRAIRLTECDHLLPKKFNNNKTNQSEPIKAAPFRKMNQSQSVKAAPFQNTEEDDTNELPQFHDYIEEEGKEEDMKGPIPKRVNDNKNDWNKLVRKHLQDIIDEEEKSEKKYRKVKMTIDDEYKRLSMAGAVMASRPLTSIVQRRKSSRKASGRLSSRRLSFRFPRQPQTPLNKMQQMFGITEGGQIGIWDVYERHRRDVLGKVGEPENRRIRALKMIDGIYPPWQLLNEMEHIEIEQMKKVERIENARTALIIQEVMKDKKKRIENQVKRHCSDKATKMNTDIVKRVGRIIEEIDPDTQYEYGIELLRHRVWIRAQVEDELFIKNSKWFRMITKMATVIGADKDPETIGLFEYLEPYKQCDNEKISFGKEKLCLLVMSLPLYELMMLSWQQALAFILTRLLFGSHNLLKNWMRIRHVNDLTHTGSLHITARNALSGVIDAIEQNIENEASFSKRNTIKKQLNN